MWPITLLIWFIFLSHCAYDHSQIKSWDGCHRPLTAPSTVANIHTALCCIKPGIPADNVGTILCSNNGPFPVLNSVYWSTTFQILKPESLWRIEYVHFNTAQEIEESWRGKRYHIYARSFFFLAYKHSLGTGWRSSWLANKSDEFFLATSHDSSMPKGGSNTTAEKALLESHHSV